MAVGILFVATVALTQTDQFAEAWSSLVQSYSAFVLVAIGGWLAVFVPYMVNGCVHLALDLTQWPQCLYQYKIQSRPLDRSKLPKLFAIMAVNFFLVMGALSYLMGWLTVRDMGLRVSAEVPPWHEIVIEFVGLGALHEPVFFYTHWLMHWAPLYRRIHKTHHEWTMPTALAAM
jgi:methylsterol monooxygenase